MKYSEQKLISLILMTVLTNKIFPQQLGSARGIGIAAYTALTGGIYSVDWNPGGLSTMKDWEFGISNSVVTSRGRANTSLQSAGTGTKLTDNQYAAAIYSPGKLLEFVSPAVLNIYDSAGNPIRTKFDQKITYSQSYSFGYCYSPGNFSVGLSARYFDGSVSDTKYYFDSNYAIQSQVDEYKTSVWTFDIGGLSPIAESWTVGIIFKNLFEMREKELPGEMQAYNLKLTKSVRFGAAFCGFEDLSLGAEGDTRRNMRFGFEWQPVGWFRLRNGLYYAGARRLEAVGAGIGIFIKPLRFDIGYLTFPDKNYRSGTISLDNFTSASFEDIDYTPFTPDQVSVSATLNLGRAKEALARIEYVEMLSEVFPASRQIYAFRPLARARVRNVSAKPISAKLSFYIGEIMNLPTETRAYAIAPGELLEIPLYAVFNDLISDVKKFSIYDGTVYVNAEVSSDYDDRYRTRVLVRGRNDWDGDVMNLRYFVTPVDPEIIKYSRNALSRHKSLLDTVSSVAQNIKKAKFIFDAFGERLLYIHDPRENKDFVQYPSETLSLHGGDCDDMTVCYASLLMSAGMNTAFVDVIPPESPENSHIYMMFDTGIEAKDASLISENRKRYVLRKNEKGNETVWLPVETTAIKNGFDAAWSTGAEEYYQDAEIGLGLVKGWMRVVDLVTGF